MTEESNQTNTAIYNILNDHMFTITAFKFFEGKSISLELSDAAAQVATAFGNATTILGLNKEAACSVFEYILTFYSQDYRVYHDLRHIAYCLGIFQKFFANTLSQEDRAIATFSIIFHDVIYLIGNNANEQSSAQFAKENLMKMGLDQENAYKVYNNILITWYSNNPTPNTLLEKIVTDVDYAGMGDSWDVYMNNSRRVVKEIVDKEYEKMPEYAIRRRADFLKLMLNKERIFYTDVMFDRFEHLCRANLRKELNILLKMGNLKEDDVPFLQVGDNLKLYQIPDILGLDGVVVRYKNERLHSVVGYSFSCDEEEQAMSITFSCKKAYQSIFSEIKGWASELRSEGFNVVIQEEE